MRYYCPFLDLVLILTYFKRNSLFFDEVRVELGKQQGKFWPQVREMIWKKAQELYQADQYRGMGDKFIGTTATRLELREGGYFHQAKLIVLRDLFLRKKGLPMTEEDEASQKSAQDFFQNK